MSPWTTPERDIRRVVGLATIAFTSIYLLSDLIEVWQGGFSTFRLALTYVGEAAIPLFVLGLYAVQRPRIGRLGLLGAAAYAYSYVFFSGTVGYALVDRSPDYHAVTEAFGVWMTVHGLIMVLGGVAFGAAVVRAGVLPRWTGVCLLVGVVAVVVASPLPNLARAVAEAGPATAFVGMGSALLRRRPATSGPTLAAATTTAAMGQRPDGSVLLYWLPLGAGGRSVRWNGRCYEWLMAHREHRAVSSLYHSALEVYVDGDRFTIEMTPVWSGPAQDRGVVQEGPVGARWLGRSRLFRYEVRRWRDGVIPDLGEAVDSPVLVFVDPERAQRLLALVPGIPPLTWGRDESGAGEMWNSNSLTAWLIARTVDLVDEPDRISPPAEGRAPGWAAGEVVAGRKRPLVRTR